VLIENKIKLNQLKLSDNKVISSATFINRQVVIPSSQHRLDSAIATLSTGDSTGIYSDV
jgi:hypothetical protein